MNNSENAGCIMALLWIVTVGISIGSGILAWNWIEPHNFFGAILFIIVWGIMSKIGHFVGIGIVSIFNRRD